VLIYESKADAVGQLFQNWDPKGNQIKTSSIIGLPKKGPSK
jgi:hypothetical protein